METIILHRGYIGVIEKKMDTTKLCRDCVGAILG